MLSQVPVGCLGKPEDIAIF